MGVARCGEKPLTVAMARKGLPLTAAGEAIVCDSNARRAQRNSMQLMAAKYAVSVKTRCLICDASRLCKAMRLRVASRDNLIA